jgi:acyl carrier protein
MINISMHGIIRNKKETRMNIQDIKKRVIKVIEEETDVHIVSTKQTMGGDFGADSLDMIEIFMALE